MTIPYHSEFAPNGSMDPSTYILNYLDDLQKPIALILASNFGLQGIRIKTIWNHSTQVEHTLKFSQSNVLPKSENTCAPAAGQNPRTCVSCICCETRLKSTTFMRIPLAGWFGTSTWVKTNIRQLSKLSSFEPEKMRAIPQNCKAARCFSAARGSIWSAGIAASLIPRVWSDWIPIYATHSSRDMRVGFRLFSMYSIVLYYDSGWLFV